MTFTLQTVLEHMDKDLEKVRFIDTLAAKRTEIMTVRETMKTEDYKVYKDSKVELLVSKWDDRQGTYLSIVLQGTLEEYEEMQKRKQGKAQ
jgi:hypothetical protein